jgi:hypothetical protein
VDKYAVNAAALKFMACGSITYHWQLNPFITTCDFLRLFVVVEFNEWQVCHERVHFWFHAESLWSTFSLL